jgi:hypothetical protein
MKSKIIMNKLHLLSNMKKIKDIIENTKGMFCITEDGKSYRAVTKNKELLWLEIKEHVKR